MKWVSFGAMFFCALIAQAKTDVAIFLGAMAVIAAIPEARKGQRRG